MTNCTRCPELEAEIERLKRDQRFGLGTSLCGIVSASGPHGEPLACAYPFGHDGAHAWATLPTWVAGEEGRSDGS